ncbi:MAG: ankyrin repeat domain-containing protein, partial [Janthinobacterium lividum]
MHGSTAKKLFGAITQGSISRVTREVKIIIKGNNSEIYNPIQQDIFNSYRNSLGQTFFLAAVEAQELEIIKHLANCQLVNFDDKDSNSETALHIAARKNNFQIAKYLIGKHIDIEATNKLGLSAFHIAVEAGAKEVVELFLSREIKNLDFVDLSHISEQCQFNLEDLEIEGNLVRAGSDEVRLIIKIIWLIDGLFVKMSENNHRKIFSWEFIEYQSNEDKLYIIDIFKQRI